MNLYRANNLNSVIIAAWHLTKYFHVLQMPLLNKIKLLVKCSRYIIQMQSIPKLYIYITPQLGQMKTNNKKSTNYIRCRQYSWILLLSCDYLLSSYCCCITDSDLWYKWYDLPTQQCSTKNLFLIQCQIHEQYRHLHTLVTALKVKLSNCSNKLLLTNNPFPLPNTHTHTYMHM